MQKVEIPNEVQFYNHTLKELLYSQSHKAIKFFESDCIKYDQLLKCFQCLPLQMSNGKFYNTRTYLLERCPENEKGFKCNCQGWITKSRKAGPATAICSHVGALRLYLDYRNWKNNWGKYKQAIL